jgi:hypothetical protein
MSKILLVVTHYIQHDNPSQTYLKPDTTLLQYELKNSTGVTMVSKDTR